MIYHLLLLTLCSALHASSPVEEGTTPPQTYSQALGLRPTQLAGTTIRIFEAWAPPPLPAQSNEWVEIYQNGVVPTTTGELDPRWESQTIKLLEDTTKFPDPKQ